MVESLKEMNVFAHLLLFGMANGANKLIVGKVKYGMELIVHANLAIIGMEVCVFSVLMDNNGILHQKNVSVLNPMFGMANIVREFLSVLEIVSIMRLFNNVYVHKISFGMDFHVWFGHNVAVGKFSIWKHFNVIVLIISTGMEKTVCYV